MLPPTHPAWGFRPLRGADNFPAMVNIPFTMAEGSGSGCKGYCPLPSRPINPVSSTLPEEGSRRSPSSGPVGDIWGENQPEGLRGRELAGGGVAVFVVDDGVAEHAESVDLDLDHVARLQQPCRCAGVADARRRAGGEQITGLDGEGA